jgi:hypothetical protein
MEGSDSALTRLVAIVNKQKNYGTNGIDGKYPLVSVVSLEVPSLFSYFFFGTAFTNEARQS